MMDVVQADVGACEHRSMLRWARQASYWAEALRASEPIIRFRQTSSDTRSQVSQQAKDDQDFLGLICVETPCRRVLSNEKHLKARRAYGDLREITPAPQCCKRCYASGRIMSPSAAPTARYPHQAHLRMSGASTVIHGASDPRFCSLLVNSVVQSKSTRSEYFLIDHLIG